MALHVNVTSKRAKLNSAAKVFSPTVSSRQTEKDDTKFEMTSSEADPIFREALNAIFGIPYGGSLAFLRNGLTNESVTEMNSFGEGSVFVPTALIVPEKLAVSCESMGLGSVDEPQARLLVNGKDFAPNHTGFNFLVINPATMDAYVAVFNTSSQIGNESKHMAQFIYSIDPQAVVLMAVKGDGVRRLHPMAREALRYLGVEIPEHDDAQTLAKCIVEIPPDDAQAADLLNICAIVNAAKCASVLVNAGWNVNHQKEHGTKNTALLDAVFYGSFNVVRVLVSECEADVGLRNKWGETANNIAEKLFELTLEDIVNDSKESQLPKSPDSEDVVRV